MVHLILVTKYRKKLFYGNLRDDIKQYIYDICRQNHWYIKRMETDKDHIHILFRCKPTLIFKDYVQALKGRSARYLRAKYPDYLKTMLQGKHFWSPTYFLVTTGNVTIDILKQYVENQRKELIDSDE